MFLVYHGDAEDMVYGEPEFYDTQKEADERADQRFAKGLPDGHAITVYECREKRTLAAPAAAS